MIFERNQVYLFFLLTDALGWAKEHCQLSPYCVTFNDGEIRAEAGLCAVIPCSFTSAFVPNTIIWYKCESRDRCEESDIVFHSDKNNENVKLGFKGRVSLLDPDVTQKNCSIIINDLEKSDSGSYQLRIEGKESRDKFTYTAKTVLSLSGKKIFGITLHLIYKHKKTKSYCYYFYSPLRADCKIFISKTKKMYLKT